MPRKATPKPSRPAATPRKAVRTQQPSASAASLALKNVGAGALDAFRGVVADRIVSMPIGALHVSRHQTRTHDEHQIALIMGSFERFGLINPIIADESGEIIAGAARFEAARRLGVASLPIVPVSHLSADEKRAYRLADNRIALLAGWDTAALAVELEHLIEIEFDLGSLGFEVPEIDLVLMGDDDDGVDEADAPVSVDQAVTPIVRLGDVFRLGRHRLLCGDALDPASYERLMDGDEARMVLADAPFNCKIDGFVGGLGKVKHREFAMATGEMSRNEFQDFLACFYRNASHHLVDGGLVYAFMDWRQQLPLLLAADEAGLAHINTCVWNKLTGGMGSFYRSQHEFCAIHKKGSAPHLNLVELGRHGRYRTNVWDHQGMAGFSKDRDELLASHPTVKPWALLAEAIRDCTRQGDIVLDPFLGSGSTLIAAERTGRACRGIELDPVYCEVIIARFEKLTGREAVHEASGMSFEALRAHRQTTVADVPNGEELGSATKPDAMEAQAAPGPAVEPPTSRPVVRQRRRPSPANAQTPLLLVIDHQPELHGQAEEKCHA